MPANENAAQAHACSVETIGANGQIASRGAFAGFGLKRGSHASASQPVRRTVKTDPTAADWQASSRSARRRYLLTADRLAGAAFAFALPPALPSPDCFANTERAAA